MAFCTKCGTQVTGSFCRQCGTPAAVAGGEAGAVKRRGMHPVVVVLLVLVGLFVLGIVALVGTGLYVARHGGGIALAKMIARGNPNMEIVRTDDGAGTITLRDRRNGKEVTLTFDDVRRNGIRLLAEDNGKSASVQVGGDAKLPAWVPAYPGAHLQGLFSANGESEGGAGEAGSFMFTLPDPPQKVAEFYRAEAARLGMHVETKEFGGMRITVGAKNEGDRRGFKAVVTTEGNGTRVNLTYGRER